MLLSAQLLGGLVARRDQLALARPTVGDELGDPPHGPAVLKLVEDVDQVVPRRDAEPATRLHERVSVGEALRGVRRAREVKVPATQSRLTDGALDLAVVDLEAAIRETAAYERPLLRKPSAMAS